MLDSAISSNLCPYDQTSDDSFDKCKREAEALYQKCLQRDFKHTAIQNFNS
jgi:hypothetical protein